MANLRTPPRAFRSAGSVLLVALLVASVLPLPSVAAADRPGDWRPANPAQPITGTATSTATSTSTASAYRAHVADATPDAGVPTSASPDAPGPSVAYEQAMEHANDQVDFTPGGRVTVGFKPRTADRWAIDGQAPVALPAGRATGRQMVTSLQGSTWARTDTGAPSSGPAADPSADPSNAPVDAPAGDPGGGISATASSWTAAGPVVVTTPDPESASGLRRQVFGFLPYWELSSASTRLNYDVLSTIAYFSVGADSKGNLRKRNGDGSATTGWRGWTSSGLTRVINDAHAHGTRVVLTVSVFAWTSGQASNQRSLLGSSAARLNLARQAAAAVRDRGADGVNLDFEPLASGLESEWIAFLRTMRSELNKVGKGYQLTYDTTGFIGNYPIEASVGTGAADAIFIMGYDYRTAGSGTAGSTDPLSGPGYDLADTIRSYTARVSPSRIILGLPWYGRAWSTASDGARSRNTSGLKYGYSTAVTYDNIPALVAQYGRRWDAVEQSPYIAYKRKTCTSTYGCVTGWRQLYYDDGESSKLRLALVNDYGLRGAGMWALGYDGGHAELYRAIAESFLVDKTAPQAGIRTVAATQGDEGFAVAWTARDTSSIASYDVQVSADGGAWKDWLLATTATSDVFPGHDGHGYAFRVRARDTKGNAGMYLASQTWTATPVLAAGGFARVTKAGLAYRSGPGTDRATLGKLPTGTIVALTHGPVAADGYTWYEVTQPVKEWPTVSFVERGVWIAVSSRSATYVKPYRSPASTKVDAGITGLDFGPVTGASALGTTPEALAARAFSPNGDGSKDRLRLRWTNQVALQSLVLKVYRTDGRSVGSVAVPGIAAGVHGWTWDGVAGGSKVGDGRYVLQLVGSGADTTYHAPSSRAVSAAIVSTYGITVDRVPPKLTSSAATTGRISPNGDGVLETVKLTLAASGATRWTMDIAPVGGAPVRSVAGTGATASFTWNGTTDAGKKVPDGTYAATVAAWDAAGNRTARSLAVTVDTTGPLITATVSAPVFSPNGDGSADTTTLGVSSSEQATGTARIYHGTVLVRSWRLTAVTAWAIAWTGRTASGARVADGTYTFKVDVKDAAGNRRTTSAKVIVDRTAGTLRWSGSFFPQDADSLRPTSTVSWTMTRKATATLALYNASGALVRTAWKGKALAPGSRSWTWNGKLTDGSWAAQGRYTARLTVTSSLGTTVLEQPVWAAAFAVTPSATTVKPGQTLRIDFRTLEPLTTRPTVGFKQPGRTAVSVTATRLPDGSYRASFKVARGSAGAGSVKITAKDSGGRTNAMTVAVAIVS